LAEFLSKARFVDGLKKTRPEDGVDSEGRIQHPLADTLDLGRKGLGLFVSFVHPWCSS
jgi:hypothetical protein